MNVLFQHDKINRMTAVNEPPYEAAPKAFIGGTYHGNVVRYSNQLKEDIVEMLEMIGGDNPQLLANVINILSRDGQLTNFWAGPSYVFPDVPDRIGTKAIQVNQDNKVLLRSHFPYTYEDFEYKQPCFVIFEDSKIVSMCCSARQTMYAAEASVFTHQDYRGRGYAIEVVNAWAAVVQKQGRIAFYSTSWDNFASKSVARKLKLIQYGTDIHMS